MPSRDLQPLRPLIDILHDVLGALLDLRRRVLLALDLLRQLLEQQPQVHERGLDAPDRGVPRAHGGEHAAAGAGAGGSQLEGMEGERVSLLREGFCNATGRFGGWWGGGKEVGGKRGGGQSCRWKEAYRGLEDTIIAPVCVGCFVDFGVGGVRVDDAVLAGYLVAVALPVFRFLALVVLEFALEGAL